MKVFAVGVACDGGEGPILGGEGGEVVAQTKAIQGWIAMAGGGRGSSGWLGDVEEWTGASDYSSPLLSSSLLPIPIYALMICILY